MKVTLKTGREVNIPEHISEMTLKQYINFDIQHQRITEAIKTSEDLDDLDLSARIFVIMIEGLAELTGSEVDEWVDEEVGDLVDSLIRIQKNQPSMFEAQELVLAKCWAFVFGAIKSYEEKDYDPEKGVTFRYKAVDSDEVIAWEIPGFMASIYGGLKPPKLRVWQSVESSEANRQFSEAMKLYGEKFQGDEYLNKQGSALYTKVLHEVAALAVPKDRPKKKTFKPKTQTGLRDEMEKRIKHFQNIGAKEALDVLFFLGGSTKRSVQRVITNTILNPLSRAQIAPIAKAKKPITEH